MEIQYSLNRASVHQIAEHLSSCDADFIPTLSSRVVVNDYAQKLAGKAIRFEAWQGDLLVGLVAAYCNDQDKRVVFITSVSVRKDWAGKGIAAQLLKQCLAYAKTKGMRRVRLEVARTNLPAIGLYRKCGFVESGHDASFVHMEHDLHNGAAQQA